VQPSLRPVLAAALALCSYLASAHEPETSESIESLQPIGLVGARDDTVSVSVQPLDIAPSGTPPVFGAGTTVQAANADFLRARLMLVAPSPVAGVNAVVLDGSGGVVDEIALDGPAGVREFWTKLVPGSWMRVEVRGTQQPASTSLVVRDVYRSQPLSDVLSIVGADGRRRVTTLTDAPLKSLARSTARLVFEKNGLMYTCTAFLVGPKRMMTNQHCIGAASTCASSVVMFDYDTLAVVPAANQRRCTRILASDYVLDYTSFELDAAPDAAIRPLEVEARPLAAAEKTIIVQHPGGEPKQVSIDGCGVIEPIAAGRGRRTDFTHGCDTLGGSSGSAVLSSAGRVIGLHHLGRGGQYPDYNRGVRIELVLEDMRRKGAPL